MPVQHSTVGLSSVIAAPDARARQAISAIRVAAALMMMIHGAYRLYDGTVPAFGEFLTSMHIPLGSAVAWLLTGIEIVGGVLLLIGKFVRPLSLFFALHLVAGVLLVHGRAGWFVVGGGQNGMEYSALLIVALLAVLWADRGGA